MNALATIAAIIDLLKRAGILRDRQQEADIQSQFLSATSGPVYGLARVIVVYASLWDIFLNQAKAWTATGLPGILEYLPVAWLFIGPAIVPFAEAALRQGLQSRAQPAAQPKPKEPAPFTSATGFRKEP
jgi:hypothetical protein